MTKPVAKLHELLAAEKTVLSATDLLVKDVENKFSKAQYFEGSDKTLTLINDSPVKDATEKAARETRPLTTTVPDTLQYMLASWVKAEDLLFQKNKTNCSALASIEFEGQTLIEGVPVDELMGLENRLVTLRTVLQKMPTLDSSKKWVVDASRDHGWKTEVPETAVKTEKDVQSVVLYAATDKHPAQIEKITKDIVVGYFDQTKFSGAVTSRAKADALRNIDTLIAEVKRSRTRANNVDIEVVNVGQILVNLIMQPLLHQSA
jgi:hypothetical protein